MCVSHKFLRWLARTQIWMELEFLPSDRLSGMPHYCLVHGQFMGSRALEGGLRVTWGKRIKYNTTKHENRHLNRPRARRTSWEGLHA